MGYDGLIITDCLEMDGIRTTYGTETGSVLALQAGSDSLMMCHTFDVHVASIKRVTEAVQSGELTQSRFDDACRHVAQLKDKYLNWDVALRKGDFAELDALKKKQSEIFKGVYDRSVTLVRDEAKVLPLSSTSNIVFLFPGDGTPAGGAVDGEGMGKAGDYNSVKYFDTLKRYNQSITEIKYLKDGLSDKQWSAVRSADAVIFVSMNAKESPYQLALGHELPRQVQSLVTIAACQPYDWLDAPQIKTYLTTYEPTVESFSVASDIIFGKKAPRGVLPIGPSASIKSPAAVTQFSAESDLDSIVAIWTEALPTYALPAEALQALIVRPNAHHFVARIGLELVGFCLAYSNAHGEPNSVVHIAVLAVAPKFQNQGVGTALLNQTRSFFRKQFNMNCLKLGSSFPRFWPGVPRELPGAQDFFTHRGFRLSPPEARSLDLYQDIRNFQSPEKYMKRARDRGFRFAPLQPEDYEECLVGQRKNFSYNAGWVEAYVMLHHRDYPSCVMTAFDSENRQVGWTLMLPPVAALNEAWAFPQICGPNTGLIGCVGVDGDYRSSGIGLALVCHAVENMKERGIEGVFVDWVALDGWYEQVGFKTWGSYRPGEI